MPKTFHFSLVNGPFGDPALYLRLLWERRALLFDLGEIGALRPAEALCVTDVFVTHTHVDHFIGFDHLLRLMLNRDKVVRLWGPAGLIGNVAGKLAGYTWNLVEDYRLTLRVHEVSPGRLRWAVFTCRDRFRRRSRAFTAPFDGLLLDDGRFRVRAALLDHAVPCLGFRLEEPAHLNVNRDRLEKLDWVAGPWLGRVKEALRRGRPADTPVRVLERTPGGRRRRSLPLGEIASRIVTETPGTTVAYVTDIADTAANRKQVTALAREADHFFCEAVFLHADLDHARRKHHLTARQAGELARRAGARHLHVFHFSPKYLGREKELRSEAAAAHTMEVGSNLEC